MDEDAAADHLRHGDRLADRAAEAEDQRCGDAAARVREDDAAHHLPARRAERERAFLQLARDAEEELALMLATIGRIMIVSTTIAVKTLEPVEDGGAEERDEAERAVHRGLDVVAEDRAEHEDAPEPDHDARDRGERLDERRHRAASRAARAR